MRILHLIFLMLILGSNFTYAEDFAVISGANVVGCVNSGNGSLLNDPNDLNSVKAGYVYLPGGCRNLPAPLKYLKILNGEIVEMSAGEKSAVDSVELAQAIATLKQGAKDHITAETPESKAMRNAFRVVMASLIETRLKVNELVTAHNSAHGTNITPLPNRTWAQVLSATRNQIDSETDANS